MSLTSVAAKTASLRTEAVSAVEVDFDLTVLGQVALFILLLVVLKPLLFEPMLRLFEERARRTQGVKLEARKIDEASADALATYEKSMQEARSVASVEREKLRSEGLTREQELLAKVRASTTESLDKGRADARKQAELVRLEVQTKVPELARELASRVLGRQVS